MARILFYDKHVAWNAPHYALNLLKELEKQGNEIFVIYGKPGSKPIEEITNFKHSKIYGSFNFKYIEEYRDINIVIKYFNPDIYISNFAFKEFERRILEIIKFNNIKIIELDNIASEIMFYNSNHYHYLSNLLPGSLKHFIKNEICDLANRTGISLLKNKNKNPRKLPLIADKICLKGVFFKEYLTTQNKRNFRESSFPVTGSIQLDSFINDKTKKDAIFDKYGLDINLPTLLVAPNPVKTYLSDKGNKFIRKSIDNIESDINLNLVINLHPSDRFMGNNMFNNHPILKTPDFYSMLKFSDAILTPRSTIGLESSFAEVPALINSSDSKQLDFPYFTEGYKVGMPVNPQNICKSFQRVIGGLEKFDFNKFNNYFLSKRDGKNFLRISKVVNQVLN